MQQASRILLLGFEDAWPRTAWPGRREAARIRYRKLRQARRALWVGATLPLQAGALRCRRLERMIDLGAQEAENRWRWSGDFAKQIRLHVSPLSGSCLSLSSSHELAFVVGVLLSNFTSKVGFATGKIWTITSHVTRETQACTLKCTLSFHKHIDMSSTPLYNALIRTHHITSRKKVAKLRAAASNHNVYALLRYGGCPGVMYCQGLEPGVRSWVADVQRLRYKDFQLVKKPAEKQSEGQADNSKVPYGKLEEMDTVKEFGAQMKSFGVWNWWRVGMGYQKDETQP